MKIRELELIKREIESYFWMLIGEKSCEYLAKSFYFLSSEYTIVVHHVA